MPRFISLFRGPYEFFGVDVPLEIPSSEISRIWEFDPVKDRIPSEQQGNYPFTHKEIYYYEQRVDITNDEVLVANWVEMFIRVSYHKDGQVRSKITLKCDGKSSVVSHLSLEELARPIIELGCLEKRYHQILFQFEPVGNKIPPWKHFAALISFTAGLVKAGLFRTFAPLPLNKDGIVPGFPFHISEELGNEFTDAFFYILPKVFRPLLLDILKRVIEEKPVNWVIDNWGDLEWRYHAHILLRSEDLLNHYRRELIQIFFTLWTRGVYRDLLYKIEFKFIDKAFTAESLETLDNPAQGMFFKIYSFLDLNFRERNHIYNRTVIAFRHFLLAKYPVLLDGEFLDRILDTIPNDSTLDDPPRPNNDLYLVDLPTLMHADPDFLVQIIQVILTIWKKNRWVFSNSFTYCLITFCLQRSIIKESPQDFFKHVLLLAPEWVRNYSPALKKDFGLHPPV